MGEFDSRRHALFLDIDGTLLDMAERPDAVAVPPGLADTLAFLDDALHGALAFVTGRSIAKVDALFAPLRLAASGVHGTEMRMARDGEALRLAPVLPPDLLLKLTNLETVADGIAVEVKSTSVSIHYRAAPEAEPALRAAIDAALTPHPDLERRGGRKVFEVVPKGKSKGTAVETFMHAPPFQGRTPVFVGDDIGDEPAFAAVERMGGVAVKVAGEHFRSGAAFDGPAHVRAWLAECAEAVARPVRRIA